MATAGFHYIQLWLCPLSWNTDWLRAKKTEGFYCLSYLLNSVPSYVWMGFLLYVWSVKSLTTIVASGFLVHANTSSLNVKILHILSTQLLIDSFRYINNAPSIKDSDSVVLTTYCCVSLQCFRFLLRRTYVPLQKPAECGGFSGGLRSRSTEEVSCGCELWWEATVLLQRL